MTLTLNTHLLSFTDSKLFPPNRRGGILFLVRIPLASASASTSASASALLRFRALSFEPMDGF